MSDMRVWVGCLVCYNGGVLRGRWVDAVEADEVAPEDLHDGPTGHEELWCLDVEDPAGLLRGEMSPVDAAETARLVGELDAERLEAYAAYLSNQGASASWETLRSFDDAYRGRFDDEGDYVWQELDGGGELAAVERVSPVIARSIDFDSIWQEWESEDHWSHPASSGGVFIFRG